MSETQNTPASIKSEVISVLSDDEKPRAIKATSRSTQGYWKQFHANKWPALEAAIFSYRSSLLRQDPFGDSRALRSLASEAIEVAFTMHAPFKLEEDMLEMVFQSIFSLE